MLDNPNQLDIFQAIEAGNSAMTACFDKASRISPEFKTIAENAILTHLRTHGNASGEVLTDVAKKNGAVAHDDRAFGAIYASMKPSRNNAFTPNLCAITGSLRTSSFVMDALSPQNYGRAGRNGSAAERTEKTLAYAQGSHLRIGQPADSEKRRRMSKARI